jgi:hypothetical protein
MSNIGVALNPTYSFAANGNNIELYTDTFTNMTYVTTSFMHGKI